mgnify:CR=1 FL=1
MDFMLLKIRNKLQLKIFYCSKKYYKKTSIFSIIIPHTSSYNNICKYAWAISNADLFRTPFIIRLDNENNAFIGNSGWISIDFIDKDEICKILSTEYRKYNKLISV